MNLSSVVAASAAIGTLFVLLPVIGGMLAYAAAPESSEASDELAKGTAESAERAVNRELAPFRLAAWLVEHGFVLIGALVLIAIVARAARG